MPLPMHVPGFRYGILLWVVLLSVRALIAARYYPTSDILPRRQVVQLLVNFNFLAPLRFTRLYI